MQQLSHSLNALTNTQKSPRFINMYIFHIHYAHISLALLTWPYSCVPYELCCPLPSVLSSRSLHSSQQGLLLVPNGQNHAFFVVGPHPWMGSLPSFTRFPEPWHLRSISPSLWNTSLLLIARLFSLLPIPSLSLSLSLSLALSLTLFLELKCTESASVWLTPWEALYKYLYAIQYNTLFSHRKIAQDF